MFKLWSRKPKADSCQPSTEADLSLQQAQEDVAEQKTKLRREKPLRDRLEQIRERNGLAEALYSTLSQKGGSP